ncbi:MAG TPA: PilZ domain-containing protein [Planctomycetota bacterium]|nr:PilZ domain-containing protein [Planctomycetota bacterium]
MDGSDFPSDFILRVRTLDGDAAGAVFSLNEQAIVARFPRPHLPQLAVGREVMAAFEGGGLRRRFGLRTRVGGWHESESFRAYTFRPCDPVDFFDRFVYPYHNGLLRRETARFTPEPERPPRVEVLGGADGRGSLARLLDLSLAGLRVCIPPHHADAFATAQRIRVRLQPPGRNRYLELVGDIRHASLGEEGLTFGMRIDWTAAQDANASEAFLTDYVMELQRAQLSTKATQPVAV